MPDAGVSASVSAPRYASRIGADTPRCTNCGSAAVAALYADCGERQPSEHDHSLRRLLAEAFRYSPSLSPSQTPSRR